MNYAHLIGTPFVLGSRGPAQFDCYGLCLHLLREAGHSPPDYTSPEAGTAIAELMQRQLLTWRKCEEKPGAMVVFKVPGTMHCGVLLGNDRFIHAWKKSGGVCVERLSVWKRRIVGFYEYRTEKE